MQSYMSKEPVTRKGSAFVGMDVHAETIVAALARELVGFVWAIGTETERQFSTSTN